MDDGDGGYQMAMAFRASWMHSQKLCQSFAFRCPYIQYWNFYSLSLFKLMMENIRFQCKNVWKLGIFTKFFFRGIWAKNSFKGHWPKMTFISDKSSFLCCVLFIFKSKLRVLKIITSIIYWAFTIGRTCASHVILNSYNCSAREVR